MPWLRAAQHSAPVFFLPDYNLWCVTRYEDVIEVLRDPATRRPCGGPRRCTAFPA